MSMLSRRIIVIIILIGLVFSGVLLVKRKRRRLAQAPVYGLQAVPVRVVRVRYGDLESKIDYLASVEPIRSAKISARLTANIEKVLHIEGDKVKVNELLILLDGREIAKEIDSVKSEIAKAQAELKANQAIVKSLKDTVEYWAREAKRDKILMEKGDIPASRAEATIDKFNEVKGKFDAENYRSEALKHVINSLKKKQGQLAIRLSYCKLTSPYNGIVSRKFVDPGDLAVPGKPLMIVEDRSRLKLGFDVPQKDIRKIHLGDKVIFTVDGKRRIAEISHLYPSLDEARMLRAEVYLDKQTGSRLSSGEYVSVSVIVGKLKNVKIVPASCIIEGPDGLRYVFVVRDNKLIAKKVSVLKTTEKLVALKGVAENEQIVTNTFLGWAKLSSCKRVEVVK